MFSVLQWPKAKSLGFSFQSPLICWWLPVSGRGNFQMYTQQISPPNCTLGEYLSYSVIQRACLRRHLKLVMTKTDTSLLSQLGETTENSTRDLLGSLLLFIFSISLAVHSSKIDITSGHSLALPSIWCYYVNCDTISQVSNSQTFSTCTWYLCILCSFSSLASRPDSRFLISQSTVILTWCLLFVITDALQR